MNTGLFILIAFIIGELFSAIFLFPILNEFYEPLKSLSVPLPALVWIILFFIIPTIIGGAIEGACLAFSKKLVINNTIKMI